MHGLSRLLARPSQLQVLRVLYHHRDRLLTGREVERLTGLSNRAVMMALEHLVYMSAVHRDEEGNAYLFQLNLDHYFVSKALKPALEAEDAFWADLRKTVRRSVQPRPVAVVATGPLARDDALCEGRVDLTMVFASGRNRLRAFSSLQHLAEVLWDRYAIEVDAHLLDVNNMDYEENDLLWRRIAREGIVLFGTVPGLVISEEG